MEKKKEEAGRYGTWDNLWYWLKKLYGESPGFVWLYLAEMVLSVSISLVGVYMPSVLVADITRGEGLEAVLLHLGPPYGWRAPRQSWRTGYVSNRGCRLPAGVWRRTIPALKGQIFRESSGS